MSTLLISAYKYEYDPTAGKVENRIVDEPHDFVAGSNNVFVLRNGAFYTETLVITDTNTGNPLVRGTDYNPIRLDPFLTAGGDANTVHVAIELSANYVGNLAVTYQCVGGPEGMGNQLFDDLKEAIDNAASTPVQFTDIKGLPARWRAPDHLHDPQDLDDLDLLKQAFDDQTNALVSSIQVGSSYRNLEDDISRVVGLIGSLRMSLNRVTTTTQALEVLDALVERVNRLFAESQFSMGVTGGTTVTIGSWPKNSVHSVEGVVVFHTDTNATHTLTFSILNTGTDQRYHVVRETAYPQKAMAIQVVETLTDFELQIISTQSGTVTAKWMHVL